MTDKELWTDVDLSRLLKLSPAAIRTRRAAARKAGTTPALPPAIRVGHSVRYAPSAVYAWLAQHAEERELEAVG